MSMLNSFFNKGFNGAKCKTLLKLTIPRIKLLRNRREIQIKQMRRDIAKLLETGQEATARIRVEHIIREENMMAAQEIIELFCELIAVRLPIIETQRECPLDLKEAISSVCFAGPRCADLPELQQVQMLFASKYGKEFIAAATELMPDCGVNRQLIELLSVRAPQAEVKLKLLKEIAEEHELDWDPAASETELFKTPEDLLNGPTQFVNQSKLPLPEEKVYSATAEASHEKSESDSDSELDSLDFPEVPKVPLRPIPGGSTLETISPQAPFVSHEFDHEPTEHPRGEEDISHDSGMEPEASVPEKFVAPPHGSSNTSIREGAQFSPFVPPPTLPSASFLEKKNESSIPLTRTKTEHPRGEEDISHDSGMEPEASVPEEFVVPPRASPDTFSPFISLPTLPSASFLKRQNEPPSIPLTKTELDMDLQDVLAAAHAAAESAERAATAARSAASLAEVRITELIKKRHENTSDRSEHVVHHTPNLDESAISGTARFDYQKSFNDTDCTSYLGPETPSPSSYGKPKMEFESPSHPGNEVPKHESTHHQPQRLTSMEDDPYFSYPNLFPRQDIGSDR